jgi:hypothetical protein
MTYGILLIIFSILKGVKVKMIPDIKLVARQVGDSVIRNSPTILTGLVVVGVVTTTIFAGDAAIKAEHLIEEEKLGKKMTYAMDKLAKEQGRTEIVIPELTKMETIKVAWKVYIPTAIMAGLTIACAIGSNHINLRRNAALSSLYLIAENGLREYQAKVIENLGKGKEAKLREEIIQDRLDKDPVKDKQIIITGRGKSLCYDSLSGRYFEDDMEHIRQVQNDFNLKLLNGEPFMSLNELYQDLGLENTELGHNLGWCTEWGLVDIIFSAKIARDGTVEGRPCIVLEYRIEPQASRPLLC